MTPSPAASFSVRLARSVREVVEITVEAASPADAETMAANLANDGSVGGWQTEEMSEAVVQWVGPADPEPRSVTDLHEFWKNSPMVLDFIETHVVGLQPVGVIWRPDGSILLSDAGRQGFAVVSVRDGQYHVSGADDAIKLFDAEAELVAVGGFSDAAAAFTAAAAHIGIDIAATPAPYSAS